MAKQWDDDHKHTSSRVYGIFLYNISVLLVSYEKETKKKLVLLFRSQFSRNDC